LDKYDLCKFFGELFKKDLKDPVLSSPVVITNKSDMPIGDALYVGLDVHLLCVDALTGAVIWNFTNPNPGGWIEATPMVFNNVEIPGDWRVCVGSYDHNVYCLNASTGAHHWNYTTDAAVRSSPAYVNGQLFVGSNDGRMYCLNASDGRHIWNYTTDDCVLSSPTVHGDRVFFGSCDDHVYCLNATTGTQIWNHTTGDRVMSTAALAEGRLYIGSDDTHLYCLNASTGAPLFDFPTGGFVSCSPAVADGRVFFGSIDANVYCLDAVTGDQLWNHTTDDFVESSPAVAGEYLFVGSYDGRLYCLNTTDGHHIVNFTTDGSVFASPAIANNIVYIGSTGGSLYGYGLYTSQHVVEHGGQPFDVEVLLNSTLYAFTFDQPTKTLHVNVTGDPGTTGVCLATFPPDLLGGPYWVFVDDVECDHVSQVTDTMEYSYELTANGYTITVMYDHSVHTITIIGTTVIPEVSTVFATTAILTAVTLGLVVTQRRGVRRDRAES
jgi:outer membrane protein assembly factor BamB